LRATKEKKQANITTQFFVDERNEGKGDRVKMNKTCLQKMLNVGQTSFIK
jgi:hypothetical protein